MKINLTFDGADIRSGYVNCDPFARPGDGKVLGSVTNLDGLVEDAEATEILALDVLDYLPPAAIDDVLDHWVKKLRRGGELVLGGVDLMEATRRIAAGELDLKDANRLLYGHQKAPWATRKALMTLPVIELACRARGLQVRSRSYHDSSYLFRGRRP